MTLTQCQAGWTGNCDPFAAIMWFISLTTSSSEQ